MRLQVEIVTARAAAGRDALIVISLVIVGHSSLEVGR
jgi:hypothetical protein